MKTHSETVDWVCNQFATVESVEGLEMQLYFMECDIKHGHEYTLVAGAIDKMRAAYKKRLDELKGQP